jgi:hypothetical protein
MNPSRLHPFDNRNSLLVTQGKDMSTERMESFAGLCNFQDVIGESEGQEAEFLNAVR